MDKPAAGGTQRSRFYVDDAQTVKTMEALLRYALLAGLAFAGGLHRRSDF